jgi:HK97 family phage portal protein
MTLYSRIKRTWAALTSGTKDPAKWLVDWFRGGRESDAGIAVNERTAMNYAPIWYGVNKISGHIAQMPLVKFVREGERRKRRDTEHAAYRLLKSRANRAMTACDFKELIQSHAILWGNGRAFIDRQFVRRRIDGRMQTRFEPVALIPMLPDRTSTVLVNGQKWHCVEILIDSQTGATETRKIRDEDCLHIKGLGHDGIVGYSLCEVAANSIGLGLAEEKHANRHYKNNAVPGLILEAPAGTFRGEDDAREFLNNFNRWHEGLDNTSKAAMLREGIKANKLSMSGRDSQFIESRRFQRQEAALWLLLESILGDDSSVSYNSLEEKNLAYLTNCLMRWVIKWEQECEKLFSEEEQADDRHYCKFITAALLRASFMQTVDALGKGITSTIFSPNDARDWLDMDEREGGDEYGNPNTSSGNEPADDDDGKPKPKPPRVPADDDDDDDDDEGATGSASALRERLRDVIAARFRELLAIEAKRVGAAKQKHAAAADFAGWLEDFFAGWEATISRTVQQCGGTEALTADYCQRARRSAELLGAATDSQIQSRAGCMADACISGETSLFIDHTGQE